MSGVARWRRLLARGSTTLRKLLPTDRTDLSAADSKHIGETEQKLDAVLETAERRGGVLSFDEADALFGKRSEVKDSHDRYANQEVGDLRQPSPARDLPPTEDSAAEGDGRRTES